MVGEWAKRAGLAVMLALAGWQAQAGEIIGLRVGEHPTFTRLVFDLDKPADHQVFALDAPNRIVVDLAVDGWRAPALGGGSAMLAGWRFGQRAPGVARMVFDLARPTKVTKTFTLAAEAERPHRLIIDLQPVSGAVFANQIGRVLAARGDWAKAGRAVSATTSAAAARTTTPKRQARVTPAALGATTARPKAPAGAPIIAIDAGHGGVDPGAIGPGGVREKDITLAMARELRAMIEAGGRYRVFMTRDTDKFIPLRERSARARAAGASLFISVHADSISTATLKGFSVYTVSNKASDKEAAALARRENAADLFGGEVQMAQNDYVKSVLYDLAMKKTRGDSKRFAKFLVDSLRGEVRLLKHPQRAAGFAVLKSPDMPSVLVELGFLSNRTEEQLLTDPRHRRKIGAGLIRAIDSFFAQTDAARRT